MSSIEITTTDIESRRHRHHYRRRRRPSDGSLCFSDSEDQSFHSQPDSTAGGSCDEFRFSEIEGISYPQSHRESSASEYLSEEVDLERGVLEGKVHLVKEERDCRICQLGGDPESGVAIELGCDCKGDLGAAHKQCSETWFMIKGNTTCEICGATALNVAGVQTNEANNDTGAASAAPTAPVVLSETQSFWHGRRIMNFLLACMVCAFIISWLFHFNVLP